MRALRQWLAEHGVTQSELARRCNIDRHNFNRMVQGKATPTLVQAVAIARETGIEPELWVDSANTDTAQASAVPAPE